MLIPLIFVLLVGLMLYLFIKAIIQIPGRLLERKFIKLGNIENLNQNQVVGKFGRPRSVRHSVEGGQLLQWGSFGFRIAISFDAEGKIVSFQTNTSY